MHSVLLKIPNEGKRSPILGAIMKAEGLKAGSPDCFIAWPTNIYHGLFIEFKSPGKKLTDLQKIMFEALTIKGYHCVMADSWELAAKELTNYLNT